MKIKKRYRKCLKLLVKKLELREANGSWWTDFFIKRGGSFIFFASKEMQTYYYQKSYNDSNFEYCMKILLANGLKDKIENL